MSPELTIIETTSFRLKDLTTSQIEQMSAENAERTLTQILASQARVEGGGNILVFSQFNENPHLLVNRLISKILINKLSLEFRKNLKKANNLAVVSIESSASYLAGEMTLGVEKFFKFDQPPQIFRVRKGGNGVNKSPAMGENQYSVSVKPITLQAGESRWLAASFSDPAEVDQITHAILVDDFRATGSTIDGVKQNIVMPMFPQLEHFEAMAALGKPSQEKIRGSKVETALDVSFWADRERNIALLQVNNGPIYKMHKASVEDFV